MARASSPRSSSSSFTLAPLKKPGTSRAFLFWLARSDPTGERPLEKAAAPQTKVAAAELDHFCCAKIGTQTILRCAGPAETPTLVCSAERDLIFSKGSPQPHPTIELLRAVFVATWLPLDLRLCVGYGFAEHKSRAPRERRKTAKRFKACNRPRAARRAADVEQSHTRQRAETGAKPTEFQHYTSAASQKTAANSPQPLT